jgi:hypothetical protein
MIANRACRCASCLSFATRETVDEWGERLALCDRCPSPEEIQVRAAEVRERWDEIEFWCRRYGVSREAAVDGKCFRLHEISVIHPQLPICRSRSAFPVEF